MSGEAKFTSTSIVSTTSATSITGNIYWIVFFVLAAVAVVLATVVALVILIVCCYDDLYRRRPAASPSSTTDPTTPSPSSTQPDSPQLIVVMKKPTAPKKATIHAVGPGSNEKTVDCSKKSPKRKNQVKKSKSLKVESDVEPRSDSEPSGKWKIIRKQPQGSGIAGSFGVSNVSTNNTTLVKESQVSTDSIGKDY